MGPHGPAAPLCPHEFPPALRPGVGGLGTQLQEIIMICISDWLKLCLAQVVDIHIIMIMILIMISIMVIIMSCWLK